MGFSKKEREEYNRRREHVGKELGLDKNKYNALRRVAHGLNRADTNYANGDYQDKDHSKEVSSHFKKAEALRKKIGGKHKIHFYHQTDPRGTALYAGKERMSPSDYSSKGHPIY